MIVTGCLDSATNVTVGLDRSVSRSLDDRNMRSSVKVSTSDDPSPLLRILVNHNDHQGLFDELNSSTLPPGLHIAGGGGGYPPQC